MLSQEEIKEKINDPIFKTSTKLARTITEQMLENFDLFMEGYEELTEEQIKDLATRRRDFAFNLLEIFASTDIPADYASFSIQKVTNALNIIQSTIDTALRDWEKEITSRLYGAKSILDGGYDREYATVKQVMDSLIKLRAETGGIDTYIVPSKKEKVSSLKTKKK